MASNATASAAASLSSSKASDIVLVGSYTQKLPFVSGTGTGIYAFHCSDEGVLTAVDGSPGPVCEQVNPTFLTADKNYVYAVEEIGFFPGEKTGFVNAYRVEKTDATIKLVRVSKSATGGTCPCYLTIDPSKGYVVTSNYSAHGPGSVDVHRREDTGALSAKPVFSSLHTGSGPNKDRQEEAHCHQCVFDRSVSDRLVYVPDLGADRIVTYAFNDKTGGLTEHSAVATPPGAGPRHLCQHPSLDVVYCANEMLSSCSMYTLQKGVLKLQQTLSTIPEKPEESKLQSATGHPFGVPDGKGPTWTSCSHILIHPNGKFLYVGNRGHDSLACFRIDAKTGLMTAAGYYSTGGGAPRHFTLHPNGRFMLAANQDSHTIFTFAIDAETGALKPTGAKVSCPSPVCLLFL